MTLWDAVAAVALSPHRSLPEWIESELTLAHLGQREAQSAKMTSNVSPLATGLCSCPQGGALVQDSPLSH